MSIRNIKIDRWIKDNQGKHFCHCWCGREIEMKRYQYPNRIPKYISGHNSKGRNVSIETRMKMAESQLKNGIPSFDILNILYPIDKLTVDEISNKLECSTDTIYRYLHSYNIPIRSHSEAKLKNIKKPSKNELYQMYIIDKKSGVKIGRTIGVDISTIYIWLREYHIDVRSFVESQSIRFEDINENIKLSCGNLGISISEFSGFKKYEVYCHLFNDKFKEMTRNLYNRRCFLCGKTEEENGRKHDVHHVNYNKDCLCNTGCEFVPLCMSCHSKTNYNRKYWEDLIMCYLYPDRINMINI